jgi:hypothetical protein
VSGVFLPLTVSEANYGQTRQAWAEAAKAGDRSVSRQSKVMHKNKSQ